jgi:ketosteroid isomerase-like protein
VSEENLALVYQAVAALNQREVPSCLAPDVRIEIPTTAVTGGLLVGEQGWREWMSEFFEAYAEDARLQLDEIVAAGVDYVAAGVTLVGRGAASEIPLALRWVMVWWFRNGRMVRAAGFLRTREALEAVDFER